MTRTHDPYLPADQAGAFVRIKFAGQVGYQSALALVDDLSFRLANQCYEERAPAASPTGCAAS